MTTATLRTSSSNTLPDALDGIHIRRATDADNAELLALSKLTPMTGQIALSLERDPDFFALLRARGEHAVFVAVQDHQIVGCISASTYETYVAGRIERTAHVGDLKVHPEFRGRRLSLRLISTIEDHLRSTGIDLAFNLVADGNEPVMNIAKGEHGTPRPAMLGRFFVKLLLPSPFPTRSRRYTVEEATEADIPEMVLLLNEFARARNFGRPTTSADVARRLATAEATTWVARKDGQVLATLTLEDTQALRRNVLLRVTPALRAGLPLLRLLLSPVRSIRLPRIGAPIAMLYIRFLACAPGHVVALRDLVAASRQTACRRRVSFLAIGLHERDPLRAAVAGMPAFTFTSRAMVASFITPHRAASFADQVSYEDFALV